MIMVWLIIQGIIFGVVTNLIIKNKGYKENWFWWGFFFSFFAVIVAATKPENKVTKEDSSNPGTSPVTPKPLVTENLNVNDMLNKVDIKSPVQIASWKIQQENDDFMLLIDFMNVSENIVTAVMFTVVGYNSFSDKVSVDGKDEFEVLGQDYSIHQGMKGTVKYKLPSADIRKVDIQVKKVCFNDNTIFNHKESEFIPTKQRPIDDKYSDCLTRANCSGKYYAIMMPEYWQCVCGFVNTGNSCVMCHMAKDQAAKYTEESIETSYQAFVKKQAEQRKKAEEIELKNQEYEKAQAELKAKKAKKYKSVLIGAITLACIIAIGRPFINNIIIPSVHYQKATKYMNNHMYLEAIDLYKDLDDFRDSKTLLKEATYQYGLQEFQQKNYQVAKNQFLLLGSDYKDCGTYINQCDNWLVIEDAKAFLAKGNYLSAEAELKHNIVNPTDEQQPIIIELTDKCLNIKALKAYQNSELSKCLEVISSMTVKTDEIKKLEKRINDFYSEYEIWLGQWMCFDGTNLYELEFVPNVDTNGVIELKDALAPFSELKDVTSDSLIYINNGTYYINTVTTNILHCRLDVNSDGNLIKEFDYVRLS